MFRSTSVAEPAPTVDPASETVSLETLIPFSHLEFDLDPPADGWARYLTDRGIEVVTDDLGRSSVSRDDARRLFDEHRTNQVRAREVAERQERQAIEQDRQWRAQLSGGVPRWEFPDGVSPAQAWAQAETNAQPRRRSVLQDALAGEGFTFRPIQHGADEDAS